MARVLVVDDSAFVRKALTRILGAPPDAHDVIAVGSAREALAAMSDRRPDVVTLDVDLPGVNGLVALPEILQGHPRLPIIMLSALTRRGGDATVAALAAGAVDFVDKTTFSVMDLDRLGRELLTRVRAWTKRGAPPPQRPSWDRPVSAWRVDLARFDLCVIGASTGGPAAIDALVRALPASFPLPIAIVQHMPHGFTRSFAERLDGTGALRVREAYDGAPISRGVALLAAAGEHLRVTPGLVARVGGRLPGSLHVPSVDALMTSAADVCGARVLGVLLTGMGEDGALGMRAIRDRGGVTIGESEESCAVYGMPRAARLRGGVTHVLSLEEIARTFGGAPAHARVAR